MSETCPVCGQPVRGGVRAGVRLPRLLARLFDVISRRRKIGAHIHTLAGMFYPDKQTRAAHRCVAVNVNRLNSYLEASDYEVRAARLGPYRLVRRKA